jgi:hypothetical protein
LSAGGGQPAVNASRDYALDLAFGAGGGLQ